MKKVLLSLAAISFALTANAQLLKHGFESGEVLPGEIVAENWDNADHGSVFPNSGYNWAYDEDAYTGERSLYAYVGEDDGECGTYQRVIAFTNLGIQPEKSYRVSFFVKGNGNMNVALLKGCFDHDQALLAGTTGATVSQTSSFSVDDAGEFKHVSFNFWSPSRQVMAEAKADLAQDEYWNQDFLRFSFYGIGNYIVDDILVDESAVKDVTCNEQVVRVRFGYQTNAAELAKNAGGTLVLDNSCVKAVINGEEAEPTSVEIKDDGNLYVFFEDEYFDEESEVVLSFTNSGDLKYTTSTAPESFTNPNCAVYSFENEVAYYDYELSATSIAYEEAKLVISNPENDSFEIDGNTDTFTFTFNKNVIGDEAEAKLTGAGFSETLALVPAEASEILTFKRTGAGELAKGIYTITLDYVANEMGVMNSLPYVISFEVGKVSVAEVTYTDIMNVWMEGEYNTAQPTNGWISYFNGEVNSSNANRVGNFVTADKGVGFYFCQRDGSVPAKLTYGELDEAPLTLPGGDNLQLSLYLTKWQGNGGSVNYSLVKKDNMEEVVASGSAAAEVSLGGFGETVTSLPAYTVSLPNIAAGDYVLVLEQNAGWSGTIVFGFGLQSYEIGEGESDESETIINENFASVPNGSVPAAGTGWAVYDNNVLGAKGQAQSGRNRMMNTGSCTNMAIGFYNRCFGEPSAYYMTYGEPAPEGQEEPEPELILGNVKYSFSWYAVNWKGDSQTYYFQLINAETGAVEFDMDPVVVTANVNGGAQTAEAVQISFNYIPQGGKYIMKWWMTGESIVGKIRVEKVASMAVYWKNKLINDGLNPAKEERENAAADEFAGTTRDNLDAVIAKNTNPDYHTPREYQAGIDECLAAAKAMATRRSAIAAFRTDIVKLGTALEQIDGSKYENLDIIPALKELYATYVDADPTTLEDEVLLPVQAQITKGASMISTVVDAVNNLLTKQISNLLAAISVYADNLDNEFALGWMTKGDEALSDDQVIADALQQVLTACIYDSIANGYNFTVWNEDAEMNLGDSIDITGYIANNMLYTVNPQKNYEGPEANATFPGWNITEGTVSNVWWWENTLTIDDAHPAVNASIRNIGGNAFKVNQELKNLPVGVYTMTMMTADCSNVADVSQSYVKKDESLPWSTSVVYAVVANDTVSVEANYGEGQIWRNAANTYLYNIKGNGELTVNMTIGADINCTNDAAQVDDTKLYMTGKLEGFDYAAAAASLLQNLPDGIKVVERADAPVAVSYLNLNGQYTVAPQGVCLKVERYADGYVTVKKVIVK